MKDSHYRREYFWQVTFNKGASPVQMLVMLATLPNTNPLNPTNLRLVNWFSLSWATIAQTVLNAIQRLRRH